MAKNEGPFPPVSDDRLEYGASPLHFGLRAFENLLHIAYKQDLRVFRVKKDDKHIVEERTIAVKQAFEREMGLIVNRRCEGGFGNTQHWKCGQESICKCRKNSRHLWSSYNACVKLGCHSAYTSFWKCNQSRKVWGTVQ